MPNDISEQTTSAPSGEAPSVLVLTKNEEINIGACIECLLKFTDDIVILDSISTDRTVEIAAGYPNVRVFRRPFDTEWRQRNYGLHEVEYRHKWLYICDADERVPEDLASELKELCGVRETPHVAYRLRYKNMYLGKWIKHASTYPVWIIRLVMPLRVSYEVRETNVHPIVDGTIGEIRSHFIHYSFNGGLVRWLSKHNFYSNREAMEGVKIRRRGWPTFAALRNADPMARRRAFKNLSYFLMGRGFFRFIHQYFIKLGFLDGSSGFHYCTMIAMYEYWIELKINELESHWRSATDKLAARLLKEQPNNQTANLRRNDANSERDCPKINVMIPTLNEVSHIAEVVRNARMLGEVYVLDSQSTDGTQAIASAMGATVVERAFTNYADQKNWGLDHLPFTGEWIFILDADERITPALRDEIFRTLARRRQVDGYFVNRVVLAIGKQVRNGGLYPSWNLRLFRRGTARYEDRIVHEHMVCTGPAKFLHNEMLHLRRESITRFLEKHIHYADLESDEWVKWRMGQSTMTDPGSLFQSMLKYRQWIRRRIWPRLPGRPLWRFMYMFFFRFGFMDGLAGWNLARLMSCYEYMIGLLYKEKSRARNS